MLTVRRQSVWYEVRGWGWGETWETVTLTLSCCPIPRTCILARQSTLQLSQNTTHYRHGHHRKQSSVIQMTVATMEPVSWQGGQVEWSREGKHGAGPRWGWVCVERGKGAVRGGSSSASILSPFLTLTNWAMSTQACATLFPSVALGTAESKEMGQGFIAQEYWEKQEQHNNTHLKLNPPLWSASNT